jgi:tetratricopeptide (TPR) repeat protein
LTRPAIAAASALLLAACATSTPRSTASGDYLSGRLAAGLNDVQAAAEKYREAVAARPGEIEIVRGAFLYQLAAGDIEQARPFAEELQAGEGADGLSAFTLAAVKLKHGDLEGARGALAKEFPDPFTTSIARIATGWIAAELDGADAGVAAFSVAGDSYFTGFNPTFKAILSEKKGDVGAARAAHELSVASFGGPVGRAAFGAFLERQGDAAAAREYYAALAKEGGPARRLAETALARLDRGAATKAYTDVSAAEGTALGLYLFAGNVLEQSAGEMRRASEAGFKVTERPYNLPLALAQIAVYLDPALYDARRLVGAIFNAYGNYADARAAFAEIPPSSPQYEQAQIELAGSLAAEDRIDDAIASLRAAIRRDPGADEARLTIAGLYADAGRHEAAVKAAEKAIARLPGEPAQDAWRYYVTRAASLIELDRFEKAEVDLKRAVEIAPEEPVALNYLGYSWAERGINLDEAFALIEKAVALRPQSGAIIDSLGWAHYQRGDYEAALPHLEKAAALEPGDPTVTEHLGDVYWRIGRTLEARFQWERALELDPSERQRDALQRKLKSGVEPEAATSPDKP